MPLKLHAFIDLAAPRLKLAVSDAPIFPVPWDKPRRASLFLSDKDQSGRASAKSRTRRLDRARADDRFGAFLPLIG
jgi:hypothetical protein